MREVAFCDTNASPSRCPRVPESADSKGKVRLMANFGQRLTGRWNLPRANGASYLTVATVNLSLSATRPLSGPFRLASHIQTKDTHGRTFHTRAPPVYRDRRCGRRNWARMTNSSSTASSLSCGRRVAAPGEILTQPCGAGGRCDVNGRGEYVSVIFAVQIAETAERPRAQERLTSEPEHAEQPYLEDRGLNPGDGKRKLATADSPNDPRRPTPRRAGHYRLTGRQSRLQAAISSCP